MHASEKIQTRQKKKESQVNRRPDAQADKHQTDGDRERMRDGIRQMGDEKVEEKEDNWRDKQVGRGEREERHGSQSAHTFKQVLLCCVPRDTSTQSLYTWKGETFKCHFDLFSPPRPLHPSTQSTYLHKQNKRAL